MALFSGMTMKRLSITVSLLLALFLLGVLAWYHVFLNRFQVDGELVLDVLDAPVTVRRDEYGIPYISAASYADLIRAQGFVASQDRIMQAEMYRRVVAGRLSELVGEAALQSDIRARVAGYYQAAQRHLPLLSTDSKNFISWYAQGVNAFIANRQDEYPLELKVLAGTQLEPWTATDVLAIFYFGGSIHGTNIRGELLSQAIRAELGEEVLAALLPVNINPDRTVEPLKTGYDGGGNQTLTFTGIAPYASGAPPLMGSNNWAIAPDKSASGSAILTSDPHLDSRQLPGMMYPVGLFAPGINAIGITMAGMPGLVIGRTDHVAFGATNAYGDSQDTYIETADPESEDHYLEGGVSVAFDVRRETIRVKDGEGFREQELTIRSTRRGPVISDHAVFGVTGVDLLSARWATAEQQNAKLGFDRFLTVQSAEELEQAIYDIDLIFFNYVFADRQGNIGQRASGLIPTRSFGGATPTQASSGDNWSGFIPKDQMPGGRNPDRGWLGTANHDTRGSAYPYYYAAQFAPHYRYSRMREVLDSTPLMSAEDSWRLTLDTHNTLAEKLAPLMARWLRASPETESLAAILDTWDYRDASDSVGATVFHVVYENLVPLVYGDDMSASLHQQFMRSRYFWQQRLDDALLRGSSPWFDDQSTPETEQAADLVLRAGRAASEQLTESFGADSGNWQWGKATRMTFVSPLRKSGWGRDLLGGGEYAGRGSHETINRGAYLTDSFPYQTAYIASARLVMDFADDEKVMAVIPAGPTARQGHPLRTSQLQTYVAGQWLPWWRSEEKIAEHAQHTLRLLPGE
jgi:penicillin amidase